MITILGIVYRCRWPLLLLWFIALCVAVLWSLLPALYIGLPMLGWTPGLMGIPLFDLRSGDSLTRSCYLATVAVVWVGVGCTIWIIAADVRHRLWRLSSSAQLGAPALAAMAFITSIGVAGLIAAVLESMGLWYKLVLVEQRTAGASGSYFVVRNWQAWVIVIGVGMITYEALTRIARRPDWYPRIACYLSVLTLFDLAIVALSVYVHMQAMEEQWGIGLTSPQFWMTSYLLGSYSGAVLGYIGLLCAVGGLLVLAFVYPHYLDSRQTRTCSHCGYDIRFIPSFVCPECGTPFWDAGDVDLKRGPESDSM